MKLFLTASWVIFFLLGVVFAFIPAAQWWHLVFYALVLIIAGFFIYSFYYDRSLRAKHRAASLFMLFVAIGLLYKSYRWTDFEYISADLSECSARTRLLCSMFSALGENYYLALPVALFLAASLVLLLAVAMFKDKVFHPWISRDGHS